MATDFEGVAASYADSAGFARRDQLLAAGVSRSAIRSAETSRRWTNPHRGVYALKSEAAGTSAIWAAHVHLGPESTVVLASAASIHGIQAVIGRTIPELAVPPGLEKAQRSGMHIHVWSIPEDERVFVDELPVTSVARTLADCARLLPRMQAVSCLDSALNLGLITIDDVTDLRSMMIRKRQCVAGRRRLLEARVGAQSPLETRVRLRASDGGFPPDALQVPIYNDSGILLGYGDVGYELPDGSWLIAEADGLRYHDQPEALLYDRRRQNAFLGANVSSVLRFTWEDTKHPAYIPNILGTALTKAGWRRNPRRP